MSSSLALRHGVVWICRSAGVARFVPYDLAGRRIGPGFTARGVGDCPADVRGIAVDEDRRIWAADAGIGRVRAFNAFGAECGGAGDEDGRLGDAAGIASQGVESELRLLVSRRGDVRHGLLIVDPRTGSIQSLRPQGDPSGRFANLAGVALTGKLAFACEAGRGIVQVFRDGEFHFRIPFGSGPRPMPRAVAASANGSSIVAGSVGERGFVALFDPGGQPVRRLDAELEGEEDAVDEDVSGVAIHEGATERDSMVLVLDRAGSRVLALTLDGRCLGSFHEVEARADGADTTIFAGRHASPRSQRLT